MWLVDAVNKVSLVPNTERGSGLSSVSPHGEASRRAGKLVGPIQRFSRQIATLRTLAKATQAASGKRLAMTALRIDSFFDGHAAHLQLAVFDREGQAALDEVERVLAEFLIAPAAEDIEVLADTRGECFQIVRAGN